MIGSFIMDQVLGMKWLNKLIAALLTTIRVDVESKESNAKAALEELGVNEAVELITDFAVIATYGVMSTPAVKQDEDR